MTNYEEFCERHFKGLKYKPGKSALTHLKELINDGIDLGVFSSTISPKWFISKFESKSKDEILDRYAEEQENDKLAKADSKEKVGFIRKFYDFWRKHHADFKHELPVYKLINETMVERGFDVIDFEEYLNERVYKGLKADLTKETKPYWNELSKEEQSKYLNTNGDIDITNELLDEKGKLKIIFPESWSKSFYCSYTDITSLEGCPREVGVNFQLSETKITSLVGAPEKVGGDFACDGIRIHTLEGCPKVVLGDFYCQECVVYFSKRDIRKASKVKGKIYV